MAAADFEEHFDGPELDRSVWLPHYLPAWSSREASAADYVVESSSLTLRVLPEQGLWCAPEHQPPLRVSGVQSGNHSGPAGSSVGQQPFREGLKVKEEQEPFWGWTPCLQRVEVTARMELSPRSMASAWLIGRELVPRESAEVCIFEIFGDAVEPGRFAEVGTGLHAFRDPDMLEDFVTTRVEIDASRFHTYAVDWGADEVTFWVDDVMLRTCKNPPQYPMQLMLAVFDFPEKADGDPRHVPQLVVDRIRGADVSAPKSKEPRAHP